MTRYKKKNVRRNFKEEKEKEILEEAGVQTKTIDDVTLPEPVQEKKYQDYTLEIIDDRDHITDITYLEKKDPNYKYRYLRFNDVNLRSRTSNLLHSGGGWQIVPRQHLEKLGITEKDPGFEKGNKIAPDGMFRVGVDLVLAFMPMDLYLKKMKTKEEKNVAPLKRVVRRMKEGEKSHEIAGGMHPTQRGLETGAALGMK